MSIKRYPILLEETADRDILAWLESLPSRRKAETVRAAMRAYIALQRGDSHMTLIPTTAAPTRVKAPEKKARDIDF